MNFTQSPIRQFEVLWISTVVALIATVGCGSKGPPTGYVLGRFTYQSKPVTEGNVIFQNSEQGWLRAASLDADGTYRLDDINLAEYKVSIQPPDPKLPNETSVFDGKIVITPSMFPDPENIPRRFRSAQSTPLSVKVVEGKNEFSFELSKP